MISKTKKVLIKNFAIEAGKLALKKQQNISIEVKNDGVDVVTEMDKFIEKDFFELVSKEFPGYGFFGEEFSELRKEAEFVWTIDPIDGTKFYASQVPLWTVSIALLKNSNPIYGVIYYPVMDQLFEAEEGNGSYVNGIQIKTRKRSDTSKLQLSWDCPSFHKFDNLERSKIMKELKGYSEEYYRVRNIGNACLSICWILTGFFGAYVKFAANEKEILDNYAGEIIAKEAGIDIIKDFSNKDYIKVTYRNC